MEVSGVEGSVVGDSRLGGEVEGETEGDSSGVGRSELEDDDSVEGNSEVEDKLSRDLTLKIGRLWKSVLMVSMLGVAAAEILVEGDWD